MKNIIDSAVWILGLGLIPYAIAVLMPSWRWLLGATLAVGGPLSVLWIQHWVVSSAPNYNENVGAAIGLAFFLVITVAFATGVGIRAITLIMASRGLHLRYVFMICVAGFAIAPAIFLGPAAWQEWNRRAPSEACSGAIFHVSVEKFDFSIPATSNFNVYLGKTSGADAYYLSLNQSLRSFCALSDNGRQTVKATHIWLRLDQYRTSAPPICTGRVPDWATTYCDTRSKPAEYDSVDFPLDIHLFAPDRVIVGEFGGSRSTYEDALDAKPRPNGPVFINSSTSTPDQHPLTFECNENGTGYWCKTSYPWSDGASLNYTFRSSRDDVAARGNRIDVETRKFLSGFMAPR